MKRKQQTLIDFDTAIGTKAFSYKNALVLLSDLHKIGIKFQKVKSKSKNYVKLILKFKSDNSTICILEIPQNRIFKNMVERKTIIDALKENEIVL